MITRASPGRLRCIPMSCKAVVVVPIEDSRRPLDDPAATRRIANRAIVCHVLDGLVAAGVDEVAVVAPPELAPQIRSCIEEDGCFWSITHLTHTGRDDLLGALAAAEDFVGDDACVVHTADGLIGHELLQFVETLDSDPFGLVLLLHRTAERRDRLDAAAQRLLGISELNGSKTCISLVSVCAFGPGALRLACARGAGDAQDELDLTAIAEHLAEAGSSLRTRFVRTWRRYSGDPLDLLELNRIVLDQQTPERDAVDGGDNRIEGRVIIHPTAEVSSSIILGPTIIGPTARVSNSYIGPYTSIGAGAEIEGAEIERSIIAEGARIMHIGGRIEASTVGRSARIFRDFALPRAMRLHVGDGVELALN